MPFILIYTTHENIDNAKEIANKLLSKKLIACANFFPIESSYHWKGEISENKEIVAIFKTRKQNWFKVRNEIKKLHPDEIPCIIKIDAEANPEYEAWINSETIP